MKLPKRLTPNPLVISTVELRFSSTLNESEVLSTFYPVFSSKYPKIKEARLPKELKSKVPNLKYNPDYTLYNDQFSVSISNNAISFENVNDYQLWDNYYPFIKESLELLNKLNIIKTIERIGVRYASIFEQAKTLSEAVHLNVIFPYDDYKPKLHLYHAEYKKENIVIQIRISEEARIAKDSQKPRSGVYFDLDAAINKDLPQSIDTNLFKIIDNLHFEEKKMFFSLLNETFLNSLNPEY